MGVAAVLSSVWLGVTSRVLRWFGPEQHGQPHDVWRLNPLVGGLEAGQVRVADRVLMHRIHPPHRAGGGAGSDPASPTACCGRA
jgi:hypothetical protein